MIRSGSDLLIREGGAIQRLRHVYEITRLLTEFESIDRTFDPVLRITTETLPLQSAILIETRNGHPWMTCWPTQEETAEEMENAKDRAQEAFTYLRRSDTSELGPVEEDPRSRMLPSRKDPNQVVPSKQRFISIPLVVYGQSTFGVVQFEGGRILDEGDLTFVNAITNQLSIAIERSRAWQRDKDQLAFTRTMAASLGESVVAVDLRGRITFLNAAACELFRCTEKEALGNPLEQFIRTRPREPSMTESAEKITMSDRAHREVRSVLVVNGRELIAMSCNSAPIRREGRVTGVVHALEDISERVRADQEKSFLLEADKILTASLDMPKMLNELARASVPRLGDYCVFDLVLENQEIRRVAWAHVNRSKEHLIADSVKHIPNIRFSKHPVSAVIQSGVSEYRPDIDHTWIEESTVSPAHAALLRELRLRSLLTVPIRFGERRIGVLSFGYGESMRRHSRADLALAEELGRRTAFAIENGRLYQEAKRSVEVREQVLAVVSHDLKNPLQVISMTASILAMRRKQEANGDHWTAGLERIQRSTVRMRRMIEDLLDFASIEAGKLAIYRHLENPSSIAAEAIAGVNLFADQLVRVTTTLKAPLPAIFCDRGRILQVLANILGNAVKVVPRGGVINLSVEARDAEIIFSVSDNGPGISAETRARIFERYQRGDEAKYRGTGLGLAISRGIVETHGGRIWVDSVLGSGSTFHVALPA